MVSGKQQEQEQAGPELCQAQDKFSIVYFEILSSWILPKIFDQKPITIA